MKIINQDPYCLVNVGYEYKRTTTKDEAGFHPVWNEMLFFLNYDTKMRLQVFDADLITDDLIGFSVIDISEVISKPGVTFKCIYQFIQFHYSQDIKNRKQVF